MTVSTTPRDPAIIPGICCVAAGLGFLVFGGRHLGGTDAVAPFFLVPWTGMALIFGAGTGVASMLAPNARLWAGACVAASLSAVMVVLTTSGGIFGGALPDPTGAGHVLAAGMLIITGTLAIRGPGGRPDTGSG